MMSELTLDPLTLRLDRPEWWSKILRSATALLGLSLLLATTDARVALAATHTREAVPVEVQRYWKALERICETQGITPELVRAHQEAVKAVDVAQYGGGRRSNFWGVRTPEHAYLDCFQADGDRQ